MSPPPEETPSADNPYLSVLRDSRGSAASVPSAYMRWQASKAAARAHLDACGFESEMGAKESHSGDAAMGGRGPQPSSAISAIAARFPRPTLLLSRRQHCQPRKTIDGH
eukprot:806568-Rhodomonas_salina.1